MISFANTRKVAVSLLGVMTLGLFGVAGVADAQPMYPGERAAIRAAAKRERLAIKRARVRAAIRRAAVRRQLRRDRIVRKKRFERRSHRRAYRNYRNYR